MWTLIAAKNKFSEAHFVFQHFIRMDRKQFWILICIINIVYGSAVDYLAAKALEGSGEANV